VAKVLAAYERARTWSLAHPGELAAILAHDAKLTLDFAALQLKRTDLSTGKIGPAQRDSIAAAAKVLKASGSVSVDADLDRAAAELIDTSFTDRLAASR
jgi:sulfonate transport system substrate-binding protein